MARTIPITNLAGGMITDADAPGTAKYCANPVPWRGGLRRRGPVKRALDGVYQHATANTTTSGTFEAHHNENNLLTSKVLYGSLYTSSGTKTELHAAGNASSVASGLPEHARIVSMGREMLVLPKIVSGSSGASTLCAYRYAGGAAAAATSGNITLTAGSRRATFSVAGNATVAAAAGYVTDSSGRSYLVEKAIDTSTVLLGEPARAAYSGSSWTASSTAKMHCTNAPTGGGMFADANTGTSATGVNVVSAAAACMHQGRLVVGHLLENDWSGSEAVERRKPGMIRWSGLSDETDAGNYVGKQSFNSDASLDLGDEGGAIHGLTSHNGSLVVIRRYAIQVVSGGLASDGSDIGASVNTVARGVGAAGFHAWEQFEGGVAFADERGVYVWDGGQVTNLTRGRIERIHRYDTRVQPERMIVCCPGNRVCVYRMVGSSDQCVMTVFDPQFNGWYKQTFRGAYGRVLEVYNSATGFMTYPAMRTKRFGSSPYYLYSHNLYFVFEELEYYPDDLDVDCATSDTSIPCYLILNQIPVSDGFRPGRVTHVVINDSGVRQGGVVYPTHSYTLQLFRGGPLDFDAAGLDTVATGAGDLIDATNLYAVESADADDTNRSTVYRLDGSGSHPSVVVEIARSDSFDFTFGIDSIGLIVEEDGNWVSA